MSEHLVERDGLHVRQRDDSRRLADRTHRGHDRRGNPHDLDTGSRRGIDLRKLSVNDSVGEHHDLERHSRANRLAHEVRAVEEDCPCRPASACHVTETYNEWIGTAGDAAHSAHYRRLGLGGRATISA